MGKQHHAAHQAATPGVNPYQELQVPGEWESPPVTVQPDVSAEAPVFHRLDGKPHSAPPRRRCATPRRRVVLPRTRRRESHRRVRRTASTRAPDEPGPHSAPALAPALAAVVTR